MVVGLGTKDERVLGGCDGVDVGVLAVTWVEEVVMAMRRRRAQRWRRVESRIDIVGLRGGCLLGGNPVLCLTFGQNRGCCWRWRAFDGIFSGL